MKNLRTKLFAAVSMLMVSALMLTTASFAWFTISTAPEVSNIKTTLATNENLEIMLDDGYTAGTGSEAGKLYADDAKRTIGVGDPASTSVDTNAKRNVYWGNLVDLKDNATLNTELQPAVWSDKAVKSIEFGLDGRVTNLLATTAVSTEKGVVELKEPASDGKTYGFRIDLWLRSNEAGTVSLSTAKNRGDGDGDQEGLGSWITNPYLRVYIQVDGSDPQPVTIAASATDNKYALTLDNILTFGTATGNKELYKAVPVHVYVFYDATTLTNAQLGADQTYQTGIINLQFKSTGVANSDYTNVYQVTEATTPAADNDNGLAYGRIDATSNSNSD